MPTVSCDSEIETIKTAACVISDETAAIKARRLMARLYELGSEDYWVESNKEFGFRPDVSLTKQWKAALRLPVRRKDVIGLWVNANGESMARPDPKKTKEVILIMLASSAAPADTGKEFDGLYLSCMVIKRAAVLNPGRASANELGTAHGLMRISFHAIQRIIQRGYALATDGEISYRDLLALMSRVYFKARSRAEEAGDSLSTFKVEVGNARFVVNWNDEERVEMTLVTMLPFKQQAPEGRKVEH